MKATEVVPLTAKERQAFFIELASKSSGVTAQEAFEAGCARGDNVTIEAYHICARTLRRRDAEYVMPQRNTSASYFK